MSQTDIPNIQALSQEVSQLRQELQLRDQLVQQLSQELFRLVKGNANFMPQRSESERDLSQLQALREQLQAVEQQVTFYQEQIATRDGEIYQLRQSVQELTDRSRMLEQVVQELPQIYRRKFEERMTPIREKVAILQRENRKLQAELQSVSYRLALKTRHSSHSGIDLPNFPRPTTGQGNVSAVQNA
ncbi:Basic region leucine zipper [Nostoc piscinale CENA21]|uniref:Basic region leucine zipper n=1 Tax=Nostoc piscinale CENA21 TaxID=224013 RepID=A0A0M4SNI9_9NOSO|nr:Npun_F5560 family protein [Nostoc piscinale]ALF51902.1 Basic region leucine zipper [Nostoc piscinale CENA21]